MEHEQEKYTREQLSDAANWAADEMIDFLGDDVADLANMFVNAALERLDGKQTLDEVASSSYGLERDEDLGPAQVWARDFDIL